MRFSRIAFLASLGFISGIFFASLFDFGFYFYFLLFALAVFFLSIFYQKKGGLIGILILGILFGVFWEERFENEIIPKCNEKICDLHFFNGREITFEGIVSEEPEEKEKYLQVIIEAKRLLKKDAKALRGKVLLVVPLGSDLKYGDFLKIEGKLMAPKKFSEEFNWPEYLRKERIYSTIFNPQIKVIQRNQGNKLKARLFDFKNKLEEKARNFLPPGGAILSAFTLNDRSRLSKDFKEKLSQAGLFHIIAISGLHIMVLFEIILSIFLFLGFWRKEGTFLAVILIFLYILMIGAPPSATRAGIMGGLLYLAKALGRKNQSAKTIVFAASLMLLENPLILTRDISFQLSFLASLGIIYLFPILKEYLGNDSQMKNLIAITLSCQIFTFPLIVFNFGSFSPLALVSNVLVLPILPFLLGTSLLYLLLGLIFPWLGSSLGLFLEVPYFYLTEVIEIISSFPLSKVTLKLPFFSVLAFYLILAIILIKLKNQIDKKNQIK